MGPPTWIAFSSPVAPPALVEDRAESGAELDFVHARLLDRAGHRHELRLGLPAVQDEWQPGQRLRARHERRTHQIALRGRIRRPLTRHRALGLEHVQQRALLPTHEAARPERDLDVVAVRQDAFGRAARAGRLRMQVEERVRRAGDEHRDLDAADDELGIALEQRARERTVGVGVVRVRDDVGLAPDGVGAHRAQLVGE